MRLHSKVTLGHRHYHPSFDCLNLIRHRKNICCTFFREKLPWRRTKVIGDDAIQ